MARNMTCPTAGRQTPFPPRVKISAVAVLPSSSMVVAWSSQLVLPSSPAETHTITAKISPKTHLSRKSAGKQKLRKPHYYLRPTAAAAAPYPHPQKREEARGRTNRPGLCGSDLRRAGPIILSPALDWIGCDQSFDHQRRCPDELATIFFSVLLLQRWY